MSWNAQRYRKGGSRHHVPPKNSTDNLFTMKVSTIDHRAYHQLFRNLGTFEQCVHVLWKYWWLPYYQKNHVSFPNLKEVMNEAKVA